MGRPRCVLGWEQRWRGGSAPRPRCDARRGACAREHGRLTRRGDSKRRDTHEHGGRMREGRAARGERCAANSARVVAALHQAPTAEGRCGCEGAIGAAPRRRAEFDAHGSPLQRCEGEGDAMSGCELAKSTKSAERRCPRRPNGSHAKLCGRSRVPKPKRRAGCRQ